MKKQITVALLALVLVLSLVCVIACKPEQPATYKLTYESGLGGGTTPVTEQYAEGAQVTLKAANTFTAPADKEFDGWLVDGAKKAAGDKITMPAKDLTVTAQWKTKTEPQPEKWTVTFKNGATTVATVEVVKGQKLTSSQIPAAPTVPADKEFKGWFDGTTEITTETVISGNVTATAKIENKVVEKWTVTFKIGSNPVKVAEVIKGEKLTESQFPNISAAIPEGKELKGWFDGETQITVDTEITPDLTVVAKIEDKAPPAQFSSWWVDPDQAEKLPDAAGNLVSVKLKGAAASISCNANYPANATDYMYIAVKYSGTATFSEISIYGTKDGTQKSLVVAAVAANGWNIKSNVIGSDFSVVVAQIGTYYADASLDIDTITNVGINLTGEADQTFTVHGIELLANENHSFGTPTPPVVEGDLTVGDMVATPNAETPNPLSVSKSGNDQIVSFSAAPSWNTVTAQVTNYTSDYKYLYLEFTASDRFKMSVRAGNDTYLTTAWTQEEFASGRQTRVVDLQNITLGASFNLTFCFDADGNPGAEYNAENPKTIIFHEISFRETDPNATSEPNHFRTPVGSNLTYTAAEKKITYTNTRTDFYRYLEILLDNHDVSYDVLALDLTGYNGLVLGVRVLYNDELEGDVSAANVDFIPSSAYYSKIETDARKELIFYLGAYGIKGRVVTGVQLYFDAPADAGKEGAVEVTLNNIEMLKSTDLNPADVTLTAENATIAVGETPNFNVSLKAGETAVAGTVLYEYRAKDTTGNYTAGLPTVAGEYEVRMYYMGSREYNYSRSTVVTLTITENTEA